MRKNIIVNVPTILLNQADCHYCELKTTYLIKFEDGSECWACLDCVKEHINPKRFRGERHKALLFPKQTILAKKPRVKMKQKRSGVCR